MTSFTKNIYLLKYSILLLQIWECEAVHDPLDMTVGSALAQVVELIIIQYEWFFQNDASLPWDHLLPSNPLSLCQPSSTFDSLLSTSPPSQPSPVPTTRERKGKGKKAPPPPSTDFSSSSCSPSPSRVTSSPHPSPSTHYSNNADGPSHHRSKSVEGGRQKTASLPPSQPPPSPPISTTPVPLSTPSLYPDLPSSPPQHRIFPIPAPRSVKPAIPNKPEGIARQDRLVTNTVLDM